MPGRSDDRTSAGRMGTLSLAPDVVLQVIGDEAVLLKLREETVFSLNPTGTRVAELLAGGASLDELVDRLSQEYGTPAAEIANDVRALVDELRSRGLITGRPDVEQ